MDSSTSTFTEEFRTIHAMHAEEAGRQLDAQMIMSDTCQFTLQQNRSNGQIELDYHTVSRSERWALSMSPGMEVEIPSMPQINTKLVDARLLELPDDFRNQLNARCHMLLTGLGRHHAVVDVGLTPPLWYVDAHDLQRWLTTEEVCEVSVKETVEYTVSDDPVEIDEKVEGVDRVERLDLALTFKLRILSATRQSVEDGEGYDIHWRVEGMTGERVYADPRSGMDRVNDRGSSQGTATFDAAGVLLSLKGTGESHSDMQVNENYKGHDGKAEPGVISEDEQHEIAAQRVRA